MSIGGAGNTGQVRKIVADETHAGCGCPCATTGLTPFFADDFNTNTGWTTSVGAGNTDDGWTRAAPVNGPVWTNDPIGDADGSGMCFVTANRDDNSDVDGGSVTLVSPSMDWSGRQIVLCYEYFFFLTVQGGNPADVMAVEVSSNGTTGPWRPIATHSTSGNTTWRNNVVTQAQLTAAGITNTANMRVRFVTNDVGTASVVEAGIDAFKVFDTTPQPACDADFNGDGDLNPDDLSDYIACYFEFPPCAGADFNGDGVTNPDDLSDYINAFFEGCG